MTTIASAAVSATQTGKEMQFFGARANLAKCLTYAVSGGVDSKTREQCGPKYRAVEGDVLTYEEFMPRFMDMMDWLAGVYVKTLNLIHYMHDKYFYEGSRVGAHRYRCSSYFRYRYRWFQPRG